jgi:glycosyltransferase involved in cell wall biosynthesis
MPHKGLDVLLDAFTRLAADDPDLELTLAGSDDIASRCAGHEYGDRIRTPGFVSDEELREIYRAATVFCMPSRYEGFGLPALEAMAAGVPVVVSDAGALPEVTGGAALLVAAGDVAGLATALGNILADPDLASRLSAAGRQRARGLTWELCAERTCSSYVAAVGGTR